MQITIASTHHGQNVGSSNPWTEYAKMLPSEVPVPTMWREEDRDLLLKGTSLEVSHWLTSQSCIEYFRMSLLYSYMLGWLIRRDQNGKDQSAQVVDGW